jgi:Zn-dependent protease with chaperone function
VVTLHDLAAQLLLHSLTSALVVEALIRRLPIADPTTRVRYRALVLVLPLLLLPLAWIAPERFSIASWHRMVFFSPAWNEVRIAGIGLRAVGLGLAAVVGLALLLRDIGREAHAWRRDHDAVRLQFGDRGDPGDATGADPIPRAVRIMAERAGTRVPILCLVDTPNPVLSCHGIWRPRIAISRAMATLLTPAQLEGAVAHEVAHIARRDVATHWVIFALRAAQWFNPLAHLMARRLGQELEWRADDDAAQMTGSAVPIVKALVASARARGAEFLGLLGRGRIHAVEERCRRLLDQPSDEALPPGHYVLTTAVLAGLLWFVV